MTLLAGCSTTEYKKVLIAAKDGDNRALKEQVAKKAAYYAINPEALKRDAEQFKKRFRNELAKLQKAIAGVWGEKKPKTPSPKEYVKYTQQYKSRALVDFDKGLITVETLDKEAPKESLRKAIVTTLLTPYDPIGLDLYSDKEVEFADTPYLYGEVKDHEGKEIRGKWRADCFANYLILHKLKTRRTTTKEGPKTVYFVKIAMVQSHLGLRAQKYKPTVMGQAKRFGVSPTLIYAIMETESSFNPYAISPIPAVGLMQIVPTSAGRDAWRFLKKEDRIPSKQYLFDADNNIEMGSAYLHLLQSRYLENIKNQVSREYCVIAAYNTGSGNVLNTFSKDRRKAVDIINRMSPKAVYRKLRNSLPYQEARRYIMKVTEAKKRYVRL